MLRGPEPSPGGSRERLALGALLVLGGGLLAALGSGWGWLGVALGALLIVTAFPAVEAAESTGRTALPDAAPIEPDDGVNLRGVVPLVFAALVLWFKFGAIALFALRSALASTDYLPLEVREPAPPSLRPGDLVLVRREAAAALAPGRLIAVRIGGTLVPVRVLAIGPDTIAIARSVSTLSRTALRTIDPRRRTSRGVGFDSTEVAVEQWPPVASGSAPPRPHVLLVRRELVHGPAVAVVFPVHRWRLLE